MIVLFLLFFFFFIHIINLLLNRIFPGITVDVLFLTTVFLGIKKGEIFAENFGFLSGIFFDSIKTSNFGINVLLFSIFGFISGKLKGKWNISNPFSCGVLIFCYSILYFLLYIIVLKIFGSNFHFESAMVTTPFINTLFGIFFFKILNRILHRFRIL